MPEVALCDGDLLKEDALVRILGPDLDEAMPSVGATFGYHCARVQEGLWGKVDDSGLTIGYAPKNRKGIDQRLIDFTLGVTDHAVCLMTQADAIHPRPDTAALYGAIFRSFAQRARARRRLPLPCQRLWFLFPKFAGERCDAALILDRALPNFVSRLWKEALGPDIECPFTDVFGYEVLFCFAEAVSETTRAQIEQLSSDWNARVEERMPISQSLVIAGECTKSSYLRLFCDLWADVTAMGQSSPYMFAYRMKELKERSHPVRSYRHERRKAAAESLPNDKTPIKARAMTTDPQWCPRVLKSADTRGAV